MKIDYLHAALWSAAAIVVGTGVHEATLHITDPGFSVVAVGLLSYLLVGTFFGKVVDYEAQRKILLRGLPRVIEECESKKYKELGDLLKQTDQAIRDYAEDTDELKQSLRTGLKKYSSKKQKNIREILRYAINVLEKQE